MCILAAMELFFSFLQKCTEKMHVKTMLKIKKEQKPNEQRTHRAKHIHIIKRRYVSNHSIETYMIIDNITN